jgi:hypothetical protein
MLSRTSSQASTRTPRALFATILAPTADARVRAVASALVYANSTRRIPVLLWPVHPTLWPIGFADFFANAVTTLRDIAVYADIPMPEDAIRDYIAAGDLVKNGAIPNPNPYNMPNDAPGNAVSVTTSTITYLASAISGFLNLRGDAISVEHAEGTASLGSSESKAHTSNDADAAAAVVGKNFQQGPATDRLEGCHGDTDPCTVQTRQDTNRHTPLTSVDRDWAEFSVVQVHDSPASSLTSRRYLRSVNLSGEFSALSSSVSLERRDLESQKQDESNPFAVEPDFAYLSKDQAHLNDDHLERPRRRDDVRSLDAAAAYDSHISTILADEIISRYAPRSKSAAKVSNGMLEGRPQYAAQVQAAFSFEYAIASLSDDSILHRLHDVFQIPHMLLAGMRRNMRRLLLQKFLARQATGHQDPRAIFVHAQYGLGNRLRALGSAMAFAHATNRVVVLLWVPDHHLNCFFRDLFIEQDDVIVSDGFGTDEPWPYTKVRQYDPAAFQSVVWYNLMRHNGVHVHDPGVLIENDAGRHMYISTAYVIQSTATPFIIRTRSPYWRVLQSLAPNIDVASLVENLGQLPMHKMMGIHIRSKRIDNDIIGVGVDEYSQESSTTTDYWRNLTQLNTFVEEMRRQLPSQLFYVAADQAGLLEKLEKEFPSRVYFTPRRCDGRDRNCLKYAMADILLLSKCATIRGSYWSSFSELSVRIGGGRVLLAGIDFGTPTTAKSRKRRQRAIASSKRQVKQRRRRVGRRQRVTRQQQ